MTKLCDRCEKPMNDIPSRFNCRDVDHWCAYTEVVEQERDTAVLNLAKNIVASEQSDDDRDKLDVAEWLKKAPKVKAYNCHGCGRHYDIPTHLTHITCVCGHKARLRHHGGTNPDEAVIDAAMAHFGNERSAQLAWIAEVVAGPHATNYSADEIRKMIRQEMDRWTLQEDGWRRK